MSEADRATDLAVEEFLRCELDDQLGRSRAAFRQEIKRERSIAAQPGRRIGPWAYGVIGGAIAASFTLIAILPMFKAPTGPDLGGGSLQQTVQTTPVSNPVVQLNQTVRSELYDGGTIIGEDGVPLRRVRRLNLQQTHWRNEQTGESVEQVVPSEDEILYELKTY